MDFPRASGILLHPTSLPGAHGIGDFGNSAYKFVDLLEKSKQTYWQILPLGPTGFGDSPYQSFSAFAGNTNLISPEVLAEENLLTDDDVNSPPEFPEDKVDFGPVIEWKDSLLRIAFRRFRKASDAALDNAFEVFCDQVGGWLDDYGLYRAIKKSQAQKSWLEWDEGLRLRDPLALTAARDQLAEEVLAQKFYQFLFFKQWSRLKNYANGKGIKIIGDLPIFVALDSADVWHNPKEFKLNADGSPKVVAGVPPDYFSNTGQLWGNPIYDWESMKKNGFGWWLERVKFAFKTVDILRIDHFRGFAAAWEVPGGDKTAENGSWVDAPGWDLFEALRNGLGDLPIIAEDLGVITPDVERLRDGFDFPGMHILQYAFGGDAKNCDLPHNYRKNRVVYTGTHDNETVIGWYESNSEDVDRGKTLDHCLSYLDSSGENLHWDFIRAIWASVANTAIAPMQDVLGLDNKARMNVPASHSGNWNWRCREDSFSKKTAARLTDLTQIYGRAE